MISIYFSCKNKYILTEGLFHRRHPDVSQLENNKMIADTAYAASPSLSRPTETVKQKRTIKNVTGDTSCHHVVQMNVVKQNYCMVRILLHIRFVHVSKLLNED